MELGILLQMCYFISYFNSSSRSKLINILFATQNVKMSFQISILL